MVELGELQKRHADFEEKRVRVVAISNDDVENSKETQKKFPNLTIVSDADMDIANSMQTVHKGANMGADANAPTTFLVDGTGKVRWLFRAGRFTERLSPDELLKAIDANVSR